MKRIEQIDILRGIFILLVFLYHSIIVYPINLGEIAWCSWLHDFLWLIHMPGFFLVSGFCFSFSANYGDYFIKKCKRLLVPHLFFGLIDILPRVIPNNLVNQQMDKKEAIIDYLIYGGSDWFLGTLWIVTILFPFLDYIYSKIKYGKILYAVICLTLYAYSNSVPDEFLLNMAAHFLVYYAVGYVIKREWTNYFSDVQKTKYLVTAAIVYIVAYGLDKAYRDNLFIELMGCLAMFMIISHSCKYILWTKPFSECSQWSTPMYLLNGYALVVIRTIVVKIMGISSPALIILINFIFCVLACYIASRYVVGKSKLLSFVCGIKPSAKKARV